MAEHIVKHYSADKWETLLRAFNLPPDKVTITETPDGQERYTHTFKFDCDTPDYYVPEGVDDETGNPLEGE